MKRFATVLFVVLFATMRGQAPAPAAADPFQSLAFLEGSWLAKTSGAGGIASSGTYTFRTELGGHILARHGRASDCKAPAGYDCDHDDLLYVYPEGPAGVLKAVYFDNEGHVLHYDVSMPTPTKVVFLTDAALPGPQIRLTYELKSGTMFGQFQMKMPGQTEWKPYVDWSGPKV